MSHPLAIEIETISTALISGLADEKGVVPEHLKLNFEDPLAEGSEGVGTLRFADWKTENQGAIYVPYVVSEQNNVWKVERQGEIVSVIARIFIRDILGRGLFYSVEGCQKMTSYIQFDLTADSIVFSADPVGSEGLDCQSATYDGQEYDLLAGYARHEASIYSILELAAKY